MNSKIIGLGMNAKKIKGMAFNVVFEKFGCGSGVRY